MPGCLGELRSAQVRRSVELVYEIGALRHLKRTWSQFLGADTANVSEHTLRVVWIALLLAAVEGQGDSGKIVKMALVHDLGESRTGDVNQVQSLYVRRDEEHAVADMLTGTPLADEMLDLLREYEARESVEAQIVKDADHLDVEFELGEHTMRGSRVEAALRPDREAKVAPTLATEAARALWQARLDANPADWYTQGRNRFHPDGHD
jgi:putative hydrolase of HD superfamily